MHHLLLPGLLGWPPLFLVPPCFHVAYFQHQLEVFKTIQSWGHNSLVEYMLSIQEALGSISRISQILRKTTQFLAILFAFFYHPIIHSTFHPTPLLFSLQHFIFLYSSNYH
jgi:hypothetical protein